MKKYLTIEEKVKEWEGFDLCAPGDAIGSAAWRCEKFDHDCHKCLLDYAAGIPDENRISLLWIMENHPIHFDLKKMFGEEVFEEPEEEV